MALFRARTVTHRRRSSDSRSEREEEEDPSEHERRGRTIGIGRRLIDWFWMKKRALMVMLITTLLVALLREGWSYGIRRLWLEAEEENIINPSSSCQESPSFITSLQPITSPPNRQRLSNGETKEPTDSFVSPFLSRLLRRNRIPVSAYAEQKPKNSRRTLITVTSAFSPINE